MLSNLQRLAAGVGIAVIDGELVADDGRVGAGVHGAQAGGRAVLPVQRQARGVEARPLGRAQIDVQRDYAGATVHHQVRIVWGEKKSKQV